MLWMPCCTRHKIAGTCAHARVAESRAGTTLPRVQHTLVFAGQHVPDESILAAHVHRAARAWLSMVLNSGFAATALTAAASPLR